MAKKERKTLKQQITALNGASGPAEIDKEIARLERFRDRPNQSKKIKAACNKDIAEMEADKSGAADKRRGKLQATITQLEEYIG